jgi:hypothetical protein
MGISDRALRSGSVTVKKGKKVAFDSTVFLASVNRGRTISNYRKDEVIFSQAEPADAVFYIQTSKVKFEVRHDCGLSGGYCMMLTALQP